MRVLMDPEAGLLQEIGSYSPENPFRTFAYAQARVLRGDRVVAFLDNSTVPCIGFTAFAQKGRIHQSLEVTSAPALATDHPLWGLLRDFCCNQGFTRLKVLTFASASGTIPALGQESYRRKRKEYTIKLGPDCPPLSMSSNHRRNLKKAEKAGIRIIESGTVDSCIMHANLIDQSMIRRQTRGESVSAGYPGSNLHPFIETGAATIFQARDCDERVLSSILVLLSERGAYYHSAGTSPEGMALGASQFLIASVAENLRDRGITIFNLGGASDDQAGLERFKLGFGPETVALEAASFDMSTGFRKLMISAFRFAGMRS